MRIEQHVDIDATPEQVWDVMADPVAVARLMRGTMTITPDAAGQEPLEGAHYRVMIKLGAAQVGGDVVVVERQPPREFAWKAIKGVDHRFRVRLRALPGGGTRLTLRFAYDAPGTLGTIADLAALPALRSLFRRALSGAKAELEHGSLPPEQRRSLPGWLLGEAGNAAVLARAGLIAPMRPDRLARLGVAALSDGLSLGTAVSVSAIRHPDRTMIIDELGPLTFAEVERRVNAIAVGLAELGVTPGDSVGLMARNHRGFVLAAAAVARLGADVLLLNTAFSRPQLAGVCERERPVALVLDAEFADLLDGTPDTICRVLADPDADPGTGSDTGPGTTTTLAALAARFDGRRPPHQRRASRLTILTSGTTGTPKGASRGAASSGALPSLSGPAGILDRIPLRSGMTVAVAAPLFHGWGLAGLLLSMSLGATTVLRRRFDAEAWLGDLERHSCDAFVVVPVMLQRILELSAESRTSYDTSALRIVASSGSALPGDLAARWMDAFGDNLHNLYGSTEVAFAAIATPEDLRAAPGTAGRVTRGTTVTLFDEAGVPVQQGQVGRIFVGNAMLFEGYTGGGDKERIGGLMSTGDLGRFDEAGRLFVVGRDDDMIVSGGENVFPQEVEDTIAGHPAVAEVACIGVDDDEFGQRLSAFVVRAGGADLEVDEVQAFVRDNLARYKVPRDVVFLDQLPRNATGKVLKRELGAGSGS